MRPIAHYVGFYLIPLLTLWYFCPQLYFRPLRPESVWFNHSREISLQSYKMERDSWLALEIEEGILDFYCYTYFQPAILSFPCAALLGSFNLWACQEFSGMFQLNTLLHFSQPIFQFWFFGLVNWVWTYMSYFQAF